VLAAQLALGRPVLVAAQVAREVAGMAVRDGIRGLGHGPGPVDVLSLLARRRRTTAEPATGIAPTVA
jgi:hypothetical protein